ncbi:MAG: restriction endonuclease subunit S [Proteobacteria bacterium]|nr:restriction endonuclease subunit S [Pseudomonadota bacterium]
MELKPGYKQTEVGVIPKVWDVKSLGEIAPIVTGSTPPTYDLANYGDEFLFVSPLDLGSTKYISRTEKMLSKKGFSISRPFPTGTVLFVCIGSTIGKCGIASEILTSNQQINAILPTAGVSSDYIYYAVSAAAAKVKSLAGEQAVPIVNKTQFSETVIPLPATKAEQEAIAEALSDADALIESLEQLITKKRQIKQGTMQELLNCKKRLPGFSRGWEVKRLGKLADIRNGGTPSTTQQKFWDGDVLWCTPTDITALKGRKYLNETSRKITQQGLKCSSAEMIPANSIVMTSRATIGECAINTVAVSTNQGFKNFVPFETVDSEFLYYLLLTKKQAFVSLCGGSTFLEIGKTQLAGFEVLLPTVKTEQIAIATILSNMDTEIEALEAKLSKTRQIKHGMMQELLTGRIRLV